MNDPNRHFIRSKPNRRMWGLVAHSAGGFLISYLPSYWLVAAENSGERYSYTALAGVFLVIGSALVGVAKEYVEQWIGHAPANFIDVLAWPVGALIGVIAVGVEHGW